MTPATSTATAARELAIPRLVTALKAVAFLWTCAATIYLLIASGYGRMSTTSSGMGGDAVVGHMDVSLASANGVWVVALLVFVTLLAGLPFGVALTYPQAHPAVTWSVGLLLLGFSLISGFTIGFAYVPPAVTLLVSAAASALVRLDERTAPEAQRGRV